jgi:hypothetical protein
MAAAASPLQHERGHHHRLTPRSGSYRWVWGGGVGQGAEKASQSLTAGEPERASRLSSWR